MRCSDLNNPQYQAIGITGNHAFQLRVSELLKLVFNLFVNCMTETTKSKPSRADIVRSVTTSTAVEAGQSSAKIEASLEATRKKFAHLRLVV
ncbi:hypothetical protein [uncultured Cedecea sp.]|uniref:hypothetical protein n=1 Tax=uncultured Cedecea sp. TaxID=988762 RepID=UPI00260B3CD1|nr:hypothetical protein [uncultured Cedecea sp.]